MGTIFKLSLKQTAGRRRVIFLALLAALPVALVLLLSFLSTQEDLFQADFINTIIDAMLIGAIAPIIVLALASASFSDEMEDHTLSYLVLKPVSRWKIVLPKLLSTIVVSAPLLMLSGVLVTIIGGGGARAAVAVGLALFAAVVTYASIFTWVGLVTRRALGFGLVYVLLWEAIVGTFLSGVRYLSIRGYTLAILKGIDSESFATLGERVIQVPAAVVGVIGVTLLFFWLSTRRLSWMDIS